ncbi:MAG: zinc ABC transporter substrate-binding protein [Erysipelotrichaceae bacterium]|nr:zinc ABC transporter substrate-binding protein [Erysipelotrichaceae bacterium]
MKRKIIILVLISILFGMLSGCKPKKATIVTTVYPVKYIVEQLAGSRVNVECISNDEFIQRATLKEGYDKIFEDTALFLYIGELEPYLKIYEEHIQAFDFDIINLASLSAIDEFKRFTTTVTPTGATVVTESKYYDSSLFDMVDTYKKDPFIWIDPIAMSSMAATIKDWLQSYYPEESLSIENNFKTLQASLVRLDSEYQELWQYKDKKIVTVACTFGNWQKTYGIEVYPLILSEYGVLPTEEQLGFIKKTIKDNNVKYIVNDETLPEDMLELYQQVKDELNLKEINLSSLTKLSQKNIDSNMDYMTIMYQNLKALADAFNGE